MRTLSNHFSNVQLFDFDPSQRGPFFVLQRGSAPLDPTMTEKDWILTRNGYWEVVPEKLIPELHQFISDSEVVDLLGRLPATPECR